MRLPDRPGETELEMCHQFPRALSQYGIPLAIRTIHRCRRHATSPSVARHQGSRSPTICPLLARGRHQVVDELVRRLEPRRQLARLDVGERHLLAGESTENASPTLRALRAIVRADNVIE